jgi:hypothetical protein
MSKIRFDGESEKFLQIFLETKHDLNAPPASHTNLTAASELLPSALTSDGDKQA